MNRTTASATRGLRWLALALLGLGLGCVAQAAGHLDIPAGDKHLAQAAMDDTGAWASAPLVRALWIPYAANGTVAIAHGLGRVPTSVEVYLSGEDDDTDEPNQRTSFVGAGNIVTIESVDADRVRLKNNTPGDYHIRLVVR